MKRDFEYVSQSQGDRLAMLEHRAAELERRLGEATPERGVPEYRPSDFGTLEFAAFSPPLGGGAGHDGAAQRVPETGHGYHEAGPGFEYADTGFSYAGGVAAPEVHVADRPAPANGGFRGAESGGFPAAGADGYTAARTGGFPAAGGNVYPAAGTGGYPAAAMYAAPGMSGYRDAGVGGPDERTDALISRGRRPARKSRLSRLAGHGRAISVASVAAAAAVIVIATMMPGRSASWPASVATVQTEITVACQNPNVVSEPSQLNFACAKATRQILWVFALLTSGDNATYTDTSNGRKGLEPITPSQGGDIAWSLNLHHPYDPSNAVDSLQVAARAINNIIGGATLTGSNGAPVVQPGLESKPANCARYTGSSSLVTRAGFPALCALPITSSAGQAALVSDVFEQWMVGTPAQMATEAAVLFQNADNPGNPRVQAILNSLTESGL